jgi:hypothetical protein
MTFKYVYESRDVEGEDSPRCDYSYSITISGFLLIRHSPTK